MPIQTGDTKFASAGLEIHLTGGTKMFRHRI
jgi:hypothetical protein